MLKPEEIDHINLVNWFNYEFPELKDDLHHFANERYLIPQANGGHWQIGRKLKRMQVTKGVADFFLALPTNDSYGLWLELKVKGGRLSDEQKEFLKRKSMRGYTSVSVIGFEAAKQIIMSYLEEYISNRIK